MQIGMTSGAVKALAINFFSWDLLQQLNKTQTTAPSVSSFYAAGVNHSDPQNWKVHILMYGYNNWRELFSSAFLKYTSPSLNCQGWASQLFRRWLFICLPGTN